MCDSEALTAILALNQVCCPATCKYLEQCVYSTQHINLKKLLVSVNKYNKRGTKSH